MQTILRIRAVQEVTGISRSTIYGLLSESSFPRPVKLGKRAVGWLETDIEKWIEDRPKTSPVRLEPKK